METEPNTRKILTDGEPYFGVINQRLEKTGPRGKKVWVSAGGGGNYFDLTGVEEKIIKEHGSPVIVYSDGTIEPIARNKDSLDF